ncbi:MAG: Fe-S cluster assembly protein SufD [Gemmataceae bacterium]
MTTATKTPSATAAYLSAFNDRETALTAGDRPAVRRLRSAAIARFGEIGFPGERNEDWKFSNVGPYTRTTFRLPPADVSRTERTVEAAALPPGVLLMSLADAAQKHPELVEPYLGQLADHKYHAFAGLNTAFWQDGAFLHVPDGVAVEAPVFLTSRATAVDGEPTLWYRRVLVVLGRNSQARVVESFAGDGGTYATNAVAEFVLADGASLDHYKIQEEATEAFHLAGTHVQQGRDSRFSTHYVGLGGGFVRNEVRVVFGGTNGEATVNGLYRAAGTQHHDTLTVIDHAQPHCASHELYKGILDGKARGVFNGKIFVRLDAQKTDAKQTNQTLLLSDDATINTKPQLEIFADDVKCTHGATVGQLDDDQLFYLRARGIGDEQARALLTFAFANDIISRIQVPALRERLEQVLLQSSHLPPLADFEV